MKEHLPAVEGSLLDPGRSLSQVSWRKAKPTPKVVLPASQEAAVPE